VGKVIRKRERSQAISVAMQELDAGLQCRVGFFETSKYPNGMPVAAVATVQEFGYAPGGIPARPFMRPTIAEQSPEWTRLFGRAAKAIANGKIDAADALEQLGALAAGDVRKTISGITSPPLKEATIAARRRRYAKPGGKLDKPLVDTGIMLGAVTHLVTKGGE
jgi:hypothetical protein